MSPRSKSTLFLIEQLIVVAVFAICAAACVRIFTAAFFTASEARDTSNAIHIAESGAESFKATGGDIDKVAGVLGGIAHVEGDDAVSVVYYDRDWQVTDYDEAQYCLTLSVLKQQPATPLLISGELSVETLSGERLIAFPLASVTRSQEHGQEHG